MYYESKDEMVSGKKMEKHEAVAYLDNLVECFSFLQDKATDDIMVCISSDKEIQICGLANLAISAGIPYITEDWSGNKVMKSKMYEVWFPYKGWKFFELVDKWGKAS